MIAAAHATDEELRALGLRKSGELIRLQLFCVEKVQDLLEKFLLKNKSKRRLETFNSLPHKRSKGKAREGKWYKRSTTWVASLE